MIRVVHPIAFMLDKRSILSYISLKLNNGLSACGPSCNPNSNIPDGSWPGHVENVAATDGFEDLVTNLSLNAYLIEDHHYSSRNPEKGRAGVSPD